MKFLGLRASTLLSFQSDENNNDKIEALFNGVHGREICVNKYSYVRIVLTNKA